MTTKWIDVEKVEQYTEKIREDVKFHVQIVRRPPKPVGSSVLVGFELEYAEVCDVFDTCSLYDFDAARSKFKWHRDWRHVYEMSGPPMPLQWPLPRQYVYYHSVMELIANYDGFRVAHYVFDDDERSCGSHIHFSAVSSTLAAKMHDWLIVLSHHLKPVATLRTQVTEYREGGDYEYEVKRYSLCYREMVGHYCVTPMLISRHFYEDAEKTDAGWRGYEPEDRNAFFAVELNKYRKRDVTVEFRLNEQHWLSSIVVVDIVRVLAEKYRVPVINVEKYYQDYVYPCKLLWSPIDWEYYAYKTSDVLERLKTPRDLYQFLLEEHERELLPITRKVAEIAMRNLWVSYKDYLQLEKELAEAVDCSACLEVNRMARKLYQLKVGF